MLNDDFGQILSRFPELQDPSPVVPIGTGLINETFQVGEHHVLQRLHPIFGAEVNQDIAALTEVLRAASVPVPCLLETANGALFVEVAEGPKAGIWRLMTRLEGRTLDRVERPAQARHLGAMLARIHGALLELEHDFAFSRLGVHDTPAHMAKMVLALEKHVEHRLFAEVEALAQAIMARWEDWGDIPALPRRITHGDPKISNFLFDEHDAVVGVLDLDTFSRSGLDVEMGDALRSWCNRQDESGGSPTFDLDLCQATLEGYAEHGGAWLARSELASFVRAPERICLELAARFAADALEESYFGWDASVAPTRGEHNLLRARGQLELAIDVGKKSDAIERIVRAVAGHR